MDPTRYLRICYAPDGDSGAAAPSAPSGDTPLIGETSVPGDSSSGDSFEGLGGFDEVEISAEAGASDGVTPPQAGAVTAPASATPPSTADASATPPAQPAPAVAQSASPPVPAPAQEAPAVPPSSPAPQEGGAQPPASIPSDPAGLARELEANRDALIETLAADARFGLSADEATMLETNPAQAVPRLLARTYYQAMTATLAHMANLVPTMIHRQMEGSKLQQKNESEFYGKFPVLKPDQHGNDVNTFARIVRQTNPQLSKDDFFAMTAAAVMAKHGLVAQPVAPAAAPAAIPKPATPPFVPVSPGASVRTSPVDENPFAGLGQDFDV